MSKGVDRVEGINLLNNPFPYRMDPEYPLSGVLIVLLTDDYFVNDFRFETKIQFWRLPIYMVI